MSTIEPMTNFNAYQTRVVGEKSDLDAKISALDFFISRADFHVVVRSALEQQLLHKQLSAMRSYRNILDKRIKLWSAFQ